MAARSALSFLAIIAFVAVANASVAPGVLFSSLNRTLIVTAQINGEPIAMDGSSHMKWGRDNLTVTWRLNESFAGKDSNYKQVWIKLCYGAISAADRPWRKNNADLKESKTCKYGIKRQNYTAEGSTVTYQAPDDVPDAMYFVRVFALNSSAPTAGPGATAVAFGHTTDVNRTKYLFHVEAFSGRNTGITITIIVMSVVSYVILVGYFFVERAMKKQN